MSGVTKALGEADWLDAKRVTVYSRMFVAIYAAAIVIVLLLSPQLIDPMGKPVGTDFIGFWSAGRLALEGRAADAYDYQRQLAMEQKALPFRDGQSAPPLPFLYPPTFMVGASALALLPYGAALGLWMAATLPIYLAAVRGILPTTEKRRTAMMVALAFPAVLSNLSHGQNGFLTAGLLGGALVLLERWPWTSGILFGLLSYKPQFALLLPLALLASGYWRTIVAAGLTVVGMISVSWAAFGGEAWRAFFASVEVTRAGLEQGGLGWEKIQSIFSAVRMFDGSLELAYTAQAAVSLMAAAAVVWIWRKPVHAALKCAALATGVLLVTPYVLDYDLIVLALPIAWLAALGLREGFLPWEKITLLAVWVLPLTARRLGGALHLPLAPVVMALLLVIILRRAKSSFAIRASSVEAPKVLIET